jgi:hypothetical protein
MHLEDFPVLPEQIAEATATGTIVQAIATCIQALVAFVAITLAFHEYRKSNDRQINEKKMDRKLDLAIRLGKAALAVKSAFYAARSPIGYARKNPEYAPNASHEEKYRQDREYDFNTRLQLIQPELEKMYDIKWEILVLFGNDDSIEAQVDFYNAKYHDLQQAMLKSLYDKATERQDAILFRGIEGDEFGKAIAENTDKILVFAQKYTM